MTPPAARASAEQAVRGAGRVAGQAVHIAQGHGLGEQAQAVEYGCGGRALALGQLKAHHAAKPALQLALRQCVLGWPGRPG